MFPLRIRSIIGERRWSLVYPALLSLGAGVLGSCAADKPKPAPQTSAVRPLPPNPETPAVHSAPRPAREPTAPPPAGLLAPGPDGQDFAMPDCKSTQRGAGPETSSPSSDMAALSTSPR